MIKNGEISSRELTRLLTPESPSAVPR